MSGKKSLSIQEEERLNGTKKVLSLPWQQKQNVEQETRRQQKCMEGSCGKVGFHTKNDPAGIYLLAVINRNTRTVQYVQS